MSRYRDLDFIKRRTEEIISDALKKDKRWGLVIIRCSYESQEQKWENLLSWIEEGVLQQIKSGDAQLLDIVGPDVYENYTPTVIEDKQVLEGADIQTSSGRFIEWLKVDGVRELKEIGELEGRDLEGLEGEELFMEIPAIPRYNYFIHASANMISSFSIDMDPCCYLDKGYTYCSSSGQDYLHVVSPDMVLAVAEMNKEEAAKTDGIYRVEEEHVNVNTDASKKVRGATLLDLYLKLMQSFDYFYYDEEDRFCFIA